MKTMEKFLITTKSYFPTHFESWLNDFAENDFEYGYGYIKVDGTRDDLNAVTSKMIKHGIKVIDIYKFNEQTQQYE